jgi:membrane protein DedA with SNARE-associated domain
MNDTEQPRERSELDEARRRRTLLYAAPVAFFYAGSFVGVAFMPYFLSKAPLLLVLLSPVFRHIVLVSRAVDAFSLFAVVVPRHFAPDMFAFLLGRQFGVAALEWVESNSVASGKFMRWLERLFGRFGFLVLLLSPDPVVSTLAGVVRLPLPLFVAANLTGTVGTIVVARYFGDVLDAPIRALVAFFQTHLFVVTVASLLLVLAVNWYQRRKATNDPSGPPV